MKFYVILSLICLCSFKLSAQQNIYIQAAACHKQKCVDTYRQYIENLGLPSQVKYTQQNKDRFSVLSRLTSQQQAAQAFVELINADKRVRVQAKIEMIDHRLYIDLGEQSNQTQAEWLQGFANHLAKNNNLPTNQLEFTIKHKIEQMFAIKILAGPFKTDESAAQALAKIRTIKAFSRAFVTDN
ncbi:hypothetical protein ACMZOO_14570 [Catenovulum sp. SX2]|uniref:hypothetical protein n=1 Tax=Catenovulum sp. SX2 TaxID=3398614 RepID=UPI003F8725DB